MSDLYDQEITWLLAQPNRASSAGDLWMIGDDYRAGLRLFDVLNAERISPLISQDNCGCPSQVAALEQCRNQTPFQELTDFVVKLEPVRPDFSLNGDDFHDRAMLEKFAACQREADRLIPERAEKLLKLGSPYIS